MESNHAPNPHAILLLRRAAEVGPGRAGVRHPAREADRSELAEALIALGIEPPEYLRREAEWVDRPAKLLQAGSYPDKGVDIRPEDLMRLQEAFDLPVPVLIEHAETPLQLGYLTAVRAVGDELTGTVSLTRQAHELVEASGAHKLSVGIQGDLAAIREVSLVRHPRVAGAQLFRGEPCFVWEFEPDWRGRAQQLERERRQERAEVAVQAHIKGGRLVPAQRGAALALLTCSQPITFDDRKVPVASLAEELISQGRAFAAPSPDRVPISSEPAPGLTTEQQEFYRKHFEGLSLHEIARRMQTDSQ